ncbi:hypothetical protein NEOKW01_1495 [Nematocida sp. AWRm80]|nr:hypothetical protein NEOKW01_1495 [Nematocida sp. AWRm80]
MLRPGQELTEKTQSHLRLVMDKEKSEEAVTENSKPLMQRLKEFNWSYLVLGVSLLACVVFGMDVKSGILPVRLIGVALFKFCSMTYLNLVLVFITLVFGILEKGLQQNGFIYNWIESTKDSLNSEKDKDITFIKQPIAYTKKIIIQASIDFLDPMLGSVNTGIANMHSILMWMSTVWLSLNLVIFLATAVISPPFAIASAGVCEAISGNFIYNLIIRAVPLAAVIFDRYSLGSNRKFGVSPNTYNKWLIGYGIFSFGLTVVGMLDTGVWIYPVMTLLTLQGALIALVAGFGIMILIGIILYCINYFTNNSLYSYYQTFMAEGLSTTWNNFKQNSNTNEKILFALVAIFFILIGVAGFMWLQSIGIGGIIVKLGQSLYSIYSGAIGHAGTAATIGGLTV